MKFDLIAFEACTPQCRGKVTYKNVMKSTNDEARADILSGAASSGSLYLSEYQTGGRGRAGNSWLCPEGEGLLFSLVVEPDVDVSLWYRMSLAIGMALVESVRCLGLSEEVKVKWPNDIYIYDKKIGGILIEKVDHFLIIGVGLNVNIDTFPDEVNERATSLSAHLDTSQVINREELLSMIVSNSYKYGSMLREGFSYLVSQVMSCFYLSERHVSMQVNGQKVTGKVHGISESGYLLLQKSNSMNEIIEISQAHEIVILEGVESSWV